MTRSELSPHSPRVVRKAFRAGAKSAGLTYRAAIAATKAKQAEEGKKVEKPLGVGRRNPGRMDGVRWNGDSFVCAEQIDGDGEKMRLHAAHYDWVDREKDGLPEEGGAPAEPMVVSLLDIARPAKRRGVAKKYEVLPTIRRVIELEDDAQSEQWESESDVWDAQSEQWETQSEQWEIPVRDYEAEEWEELYGDKFGGERRSYSSALSGNQP